MEAKDKIGYGVFSLVLLLSIGVNVLPEDNYYCEDRNISYHCDSFSKYYGLSNGKCVNNIEANKLCTSGWVEIDRTPVIPEEIDIPAKRWECSPEKCIGLD